MVNEPHIAIIGTGFAGLGMGIRLKRAGIDNFTIFEMASGVGGTWRDNTYPGAACDVQSHLYSFSFEPNPDWSSMFGKQAEILAYLERCADKYDLRRHIQFDTAVDGAVFDEDAGEWTLQLSTGLTHRAHVVVSGTGGLSRPQLPSIRGLDEFRGTMFHSARWDHDCDLEGKTVAVIGTGASAIQIVPQVAKRAKQLCMFQRTPAYVMPKPDRPISERERNVFRTMPIVQKLARLRLYVSLELRAIAFVGYPKLMEPLGKLARKYIARAVPEPELQQKLIPDYTFGCKRILIANDFYPALRQDHVDVITDSIESIDATGIVTADGTHRPVDVIILCTGFKAAEDIVPFPVRGVGGRELQTAWREGAEAYLGTTIAGFPNLGLLVGPNTGLGHSSMVFMIESQINYMMSMIRTLRRKRLRYVDVKDGVQAKFNRSLQSRMAGTVWQSGCNSWYQTSDGKNTTLWPGFTVEFRARTLRMRTRDYELVK